MNTNTTDRIYLFCIELLFSKIGLIGHYIILMRLETSLFLQFFEGLDGEEESSPAGLQLPLVLGDELLHLGLQHQVRVVHLVAASLPGGGEVNRAEI